jgi:hypothetical protein
MKAEIDEKGNMTIISESPVEAFALNVWWEDFTTDAQKYKTAIKPYITALDDCKIPSEKGPEGA